MRETRKYQVFAFVICCCALSGQQAFFDQYSGPGLLQSDPENAITIEGFGHGGLYSLNYERVLHSDFRNSFGCQVGGAVYYGDAIWRTMIPAGLNYVMPLRYDGPHHVETGIGIAAEISQSYGDFISQGVTLSSIQSFYTGKVGYRYQRPGSPFIAKVLFTPLYRIAYSNLTALTAPYSFDMRSLYLSGALAVGVSF